MFKLFCKHNLEFYFLYLIDTGMRKVCVFKYTDCGRIKVFIV